MCGVNLVVAHGGRTDLTARMNAVLRHRGPDDSGTHAAGPFALGNVRLAIRDVAHGHQPMVGPDSGVAVSFNGEVWNDAELRAELTALGHRFETTCDTEVVLRGYEQWGTGVFRRLDADFGVVILDPRHGRAVVARERMGIKPLYYTASGRVAAASSEIKGLLEVMPAGADAHRPLASLAAEGLHAGGDATEVAGIRRVLPGEYLEFAMTATGPTVHRTAYHRHDYAVRESREDEATDELARLIEDAVRRQLVSDRPVAVALSGGVDSSIIAAVASKYRDVVAYTIGTVDSTEAGQARELAEWLRRRGHRIVGFREVTVDDAAIRRELDRAVWHLESSYPIQADMAVVTSLLAEQVARDGHPVLLSGEGADELFFGYHSYFQRRRREGKLAEALSEQVESLHRYNNARLDKSCMAHGVEARVPFQHGPLVRFALGLDPALKIGNPDPSNGRPDAQKYVLRRAAERLTGPDGGPLLPPEVVWRRKEYYAQGMGLPAMILRALGLDAAPGLEADVRHRAYQASFTRTLLGAVTRQPRAA